MRSAMAMLAVLALCVAGCSDDNNNNGSKCGTCPAGTTCNEATGQCEQTSSGCPAAGCGANASCRDNTVCVCEAGFVDCNMDLGTAGDGCECSGSCSGQSCGTGACDPATKGSCGSAASYCDSGTCKTCASGMLNCDGINDCESSGPCTAGACSATTKDDCGGIDKYCTSSGACVVCPSGKWNCDGTDDCESSTICVGSCDPAVKDSCTGSDEYCDATYTCTTCPSGKYNCDGIDSCESSSECLDANGCVAECSSFDEYLCVKDPADKNRCEECLTNADCNKNPRSYGPTCDTSDLAGTGYSFCICAADSECASKTMGNICKAVAGTNPKLKQCTCDTDQDCPASHPICEGSLFKRCRARCTADADCVKGGVQGTCDTQTGKCSYPSYP